MRILHMIPDIGISNGVTSVILNYAKAMPDTIKFDIAYFIPTDQTRQSEIEALGGRVYRVDTPSPKSMLEGKIKTFFKEHSGEWQALHIHGPHFAVFFAPFAKYADIKSVYVHCHSSVYSLIGSQHINHFLSLYAKYFIKNKLSCSKEAGQFWYGNKDFRVLNNAIDCKALEYSNSKREQIRTQMNLENAFIVGHIGRTDIPQKNHSFLFKVFAEIKKQKDNAVLMLAGADERTELMALAKQLEIETSVFFLGVRSDIDKLCSAFDVFIFPSTNEGLPLSVIEAQASGLPVLMSDTVTDEVCVTDSISKMSLEESPKNWADRAVEISLSERVSSYEAMKKSGWDIYDAAAELAELYRSNVL